MIPLGIALIVVIFAIVVAILSVVVAIASGVGILAIVIGLTMGANWKDLEKMGIYISPSQLKISNVIKHEMKEELEEEFEEHGLIYENKDFDHQKSVTEQRNLLKQSVQWDKFR